MIVVDTQTHIVINTNDSIVIYTYIQIHIVNNTIGSAKVDIQIPLIVGDIQIPL